MAEFFEGRRLRYEILALADQRWQIVRVINDHRDELHRPFDRADFEKLERDVEAAAAVALGQPGVAAVRVIRERERNDGFITKAEILFRQAPPPPERKPAVLDARGPVPLCQSPNDLFRRPACKVIGTMLRPLLDKLGITPIELVTVEITSQAMTQQDAAVTTAIGRAARGQAAGATGVDVKQRDKFLTGLVDRARLRVKTAQAERQMPRLGAEGFNGLIDELKSRVPPEDLLFWAFRSLSLHVKGTSLYGKLELSLDQLRGGPSPLGVDIIDEFIAALIDAPSLLKDLLGGLADLKSALVLLAHITAGRAPEGAGEDALPARLAAEMAGHRLPQTYQAIWVRILRSVEGRHRLTHGELDEEWAGLVALQQALGETVPDVWRDQLEQAVTRRQNMLREELIEKL
ncbi:MAG TPA: hypothetical protein VKQ29_18115 [Aliidongia sp.]|nr:hypothetical protein [Aliidongia sp.]